MSERKEPLWCLELAAMVLRGDVPNESVTILELADDLDQLRASLMEPRVGHLVTVSHECDDGTVVEWDEWAEPEPAPSGEPNEYRPWKAEGITEAAYYQRRYLEVRREAGDVEALVRKARHETLDAMRALHGAPLGVMKDAVEEMTDRLTAALRTRTPQDDVEGR